MPAHPGQPAHAARRRAALGAVALLLALQASLDLAQRTNPARPPPPATRLLIDPNTATAPELMLLPGVGPVVAQNIITHRESCGRSPPYRTPADLDAVPRLGPATIARFASLLKFPAAPDPRLATGAPPP